MIGSGNRVVDQYESEQRKLDRQPACPHCGSNRTFDEFYCTETCDECSQNCEDIGEFTIGVNIASYLTCEFRKEREMCKDCCKPTGREI